MSFTMKQSLALLSLLSSLSFSTAQSGSGTTTRYWDCCKPSCAWPGKGQTAGIVTTCSANDTPLTDPNAKSGCEGGGSAYMCSDQSPWAVSDDLAYGFTAVSGANPTCCQCYQLTFTSGPVSGKKMIVQATNTGTDVGEGHFDLAIPGGGFGIFDGCTTEWGATEAVWGARYGGPSSNTCAQFPSALQPGCGFRWDWMQGADNPNVDFEVVACPAEIVAKSGCGVAGDAPSTPPSTTTSQVASPPTSQAAQPPTTEEKPADTETDTNTGTETGTDVDVDADAGTVTETEGDTPATGEEETTPETGDTPTPETEIPETETPETETPETETPETETPETSPDTDTGTEPSTGGDDDTTIPPTNTGTNSTTPGQGTTPDTGSASGVPTPGKGKGKGRWYHGHNRHGKGKGRGKHGRPWPRPGAAAAGAKEDCDKAA